MRGMRTYVSTLFSSLDTGKGDGSIVRAMAGVGSRLPGTHAADNQVMGNFVLNDLLVDKPYDIRDLSACGASDGSLARPALVKSRP